VRPPTSGTKASNALPNTRSSLIWLFGYLSAGHAPLFDWKAATPWWISSFVPNLEAELGLAFMFASMIPIYGGAAQKRAALLVFGAVTLACLAWLIWHVI